MLQEYWIRSLTEDLAGTDGLTHAVAVAGGADHGAGAAVQAFIAPLLPDGRRKLDVQKTGQARHLHVGFKAFFDEFPAGNVLGVVLGRRIRAFCTFEKAERFGRVDGQVVFVADVRTEEVESFVGRVVVHGLAETVVERQVVEADQKGVLAPCDVVP